MNDAQWNAFVPGEIFSIQEPVQGPLTGLSMSVKDLFDVAGHATGAGNPVWRATQAWPSQHAPLVQTLLQAGARLVGKTITEEFAYSLVGENAHYGTPVNPHNPDCIPGGSSSGAAVAAAAGLCDFSIGTDTAGSIRLPASFCGLWGIRPTHGVLSSQGVVPLSPSFDTPGWMARSLDTFLQVGAVLLPDQPLGEGRSRLKLACPEDIWRLVHPGFQAAFKPHIDRLAALFNGVTQDSLSDGQLIDWQDSFRLVQGHEAWASHGAWLRSLDPQLGPGIRERFEWASGIGQADAELARTAMLKNAAQVHAYLEDAVVCMPTVSYLAPLKGHASSAQDRTNALSLLCLASMAGVPQITLPVAVLEGKALGLSLMGRRLADRQLLAIAQSFQALSP